MTTRDLGDAVEIRVRDNGVGVPPGVRERLFAPFFTTKLKGTGLGLAIVQNIVVNGLKGKVEIASTPGNGTTVSVHLPRTVPDLPVGA